MAWVVILMVHKEGIVLTEKHMKWWEVSYYKKRLEDIPF